MAQSQFRQGIPTNLTLEQFKELVLPHLHIGSRGPQPKLSLHAIFNYILKLLYLGCQWKELPIENNKDGQPEIHHTRIYSAFRRYEAHGCFDAIFEGSVLHLHQKEYLDIGVIHGDGTTTVAKKGGDNLGFSEHKHLKGDKVIPFCDRSLDLNRAGCHHLVLARKGDNAALERLHHYQLDQSACSEIGEATSQQCGLQEIATVKSGVAEWEYDLPRNGHIAKFEVVK